MYIQIIKEMDMPAAFLNRKIKSEENIKQLRGCEDDTENVLELEKSISRFCMYSEKNIILDLILFVILDE